MYLLQGVPINYTLYSLQGVLENCILYPLQGVPINCTVYRVSLYSYEDYEREFLTEPDREQTYTQDPRGEAETEIVEVHIHR